MDNQMKRGLLDVCVLRAIRDGESYGYQIIKDLSACIQLTESTLYTILRRLEKSLMLTVRSVEYNGRLRKYYRITALGRKKIEDFKAEWREVAAIYQFVCREAQTK